MYKLTKDKNTIQRLSDKVFIPMTENNRDYQEYLEWKKITGNTIQAAD